MGAQVTPDLAVAVRPAILTEEGKLIAPASLGSIFEWYDFYLYGALAVTISKQFFSALEQSAAFLFALLAFVAGFIVRPLGAMFFGRIGDLLDRKDTFLASRCHGHHVQRALGSRIDDLQQPHNRLAFRWRDQGRRHQ